jgi:hypothetical protein
MEGSGMTWMLWGAGLCGVVALAATFRAGTHFGEITGPDLYRAKRAKEEMP